jgi:hypothetical protein
MDVVATERGGLISTLRRGEAPILARYEGNYAATTVTARVATRNIRSSCASVASPRRNTCA